MFELKYNITEEDMKALNRSAMWSYFIPYIVVSLAGIGAGIAAVVVNLRIELFVLGIVLIVLGAILAGCAVLLAVAPKNFVSSALIVGADIERVLKIDENGIKISTEGQSDIDIRYTEIVKIKNKKTHILVTLAGELTLLIKDAITTGQKLNELYAYMTDRRNALLLAADRRAMQDEKPASEKEEKAEPAPEKEEKTVPAAEAPEEKPDGAGDEE